MAHQQAGAQQYEQRQKDGKHGEASDRAGWWRDQPWAEGSHVLGSVGFGFPKPSTSTWPIRSSTLL
jgi:hypothetical protein